MADYRQIHTKIWKDGWFLDLCAEDKLLFIYLFSNERANLAGLYDLPVKVIEFETGIPLEQVKSSLERFEKAGKVHCIDGWVWIPNLIRYNARNIESPKIQIHLKSLIAEIPDCELKQAWIEYYNGIVSDEYRIDTLYIPNPHEHEHEKEHEKEHEHESEIAPSAGADAPSTPPLSEAAQSKPKKPKRDPLTAGQRGFLDLFGAKRFKTIAQRDAVLVMEREHGTDKLLTVARWAAENGMSVGKAIGSVRTALPNWDKPKKSKTVDTEPHSGIRQWLTEQGIEAQ